MLPYHLPLVAAFGRGSRIWDVDHNEYVDLNMAYGPLLFGHCPPHVIQAVTDQIGRRGSQLGFPTEITIRVAEKIKQLFPSMELMRFANSGTEADVSATRLARVYTGRPKIIQFEGHYHGWSDTLFNRYHALLDELPTGPYGPALPGTAGLNGAPHENLLVRWNEIDALRQCLEDHAGQIAGVIMEPVMGNSGVIPPQAGYLESVRKATTEHGALLIFDEVITGLRVAPGGAQERYGVRPDITVISKALGGGYPVAAFGASREIMQLIVDGTMFHGGVYSGNAVVMAAAEAVLDEVLANGTAIYQHLEDVTDQLARGIDTILDAARSRTSFTRSDRCSRSSSPTATSMRSTSIATCAGTATSRNTSACSTSCRRPAPTTIPTSSSRCSSQPHTRLTTSELCSSGSSRPYRALKAKSEPS